jgi:ABC-type transporter Mla subunit MlaD
LTGTGDWAVVFREVAVGVGVLLIGIGFLYASIQLGRILRRLGTTLDEVDRQIAMLSAPIANTLDRVSGIADTADQTLARAGGAVGQLERVASSLAKATALVGAALEPAVINVGSTLTGITAGLRRLVRGEAKP